MGQLRVRIISAIGALALLYFSYYFFDRVGVYILGYFIFLFGCREYYNLEMKQLIDSKLGFLFYLISCAGVLAALSFLKENMFSLVVLIFCLFVSTTIVQHQKKQSLIAIKQYIMASLIGFMYTAVFPSFIIRIFLVDEGKKLLLVLLSIVFIGDSAAYFAGNLFGKTKVAPKISPKKTVEGSIGGLLFSVVTGVLLLELFQIETSYFYTIPTVFLIALMAQFGDFFESMIKRASNTKDSGSLLPGHGGVLDRLDGVYFAAPAFYFFYIAFHSFRAII